MSIEWWMVASAMAMTIAAMTAAVATAALVRSGRSMTGPQRGQQHVAERTMRIVLQLGAIHAALERLAVCRHEDPAAAERLLKEEIRKHIRAACSQLEEIIPEAARSNPAMVPALHRAGWFASSLDNRFENAGLGTLGFGVPRLSRIRSGVEGLGAVLYYAVRRGGGSDRLAGRLQEYLEPFKAHHAAVARTIEGGGRLTSMFGDAA